MQPTVAANYIAIDQNKDPKHNLKKNCVSEYF